MASVGLSVPPGLTVSTEACQEYQRGGRRLPTGLWEEILEGLSGMEAEIDREFGDASRPLLVSVRSGAAVSMPGMMDTVLNLGLNDEVVAGLASKGGERFAYDSYRRFLDMFGDVEWLSRATNWAKFSATAGLGVIHRGHLQQGRSLMAPYLPQSGAVGGGSPYSEGGALFALGLIHANHGEGIKQFLRESLQNTSAEVIQHGACLGLGLAALGTADEEIYEDVKNVLYTDNAVAGEAAGISMGLLMVGTASEKASEMLAYAHDTQHEKIIR